MSITNLACRTATWRRISAA